MTFHWGTGITIFFCFFVVSMTCLVVATTRHPPQMVQQDYYTLDLNYQERLEQKQNAAALAAPPQVYFDASGKSIQITMPTGMMAAQGTVKCYRSSTTADDYTAKVEYASSVHIPAGDFATGRWHVDLDWTVADGKKYFWATTVDVQ